MNVGHKQVKLHGLLLTFINFVDSLEDAIDYPKRGHKKRKKRRRNREGREALAQLLTLMLAQFISLLLPAKMVLLGCPQTISSISILRHLDRTLMG